MARGREGQEKGEGMGRGNLAPTVISKSRHLWRAMLARSATGSGVFLPRFTSARQWLDRSATHTY